MDVRAKHKGRANEVDRLIGCNICRLRRAAGLSQPALSARIGISFQQLQKYERGSNRIPASRLYEVSVVLGIPVGEFFQIAAAK